MARSLLEVLASRVEADSKAAKPPWVFVVFLIFQTQYLLHMASYPPGQGDARRRVEEDPLDYDDAVSVEVEEARWRIEPGALPRAIAKA